MSSRFDLSIYDEVRANADLIYERLANGTMPCYRCEAGSRSASNGAGGTMYGLLQLSDKSAGCDFDASHEKTRPRPRGAYRRDARCDT